MLLFRINRYFGAAGGVAMRMCEAHFGITRREWGVMATVAANEGLLSSELAERAQLDRARTSRALSGLEERAGCSAAARDRRRVAVSLTAEGRRMYGLILPRMAQIHLDLVSVLSDEELEQFDTLLARLQRHALTLEAEGRYDALPRVDRGRHRR